MAIAAEGQRQRYYVAPTAEHEKAAEVVRPSNIPEAELPKQALGFRVQGYGMRSWADLFTNRQLTALTTFTDLVGEARERVLLDGGDPAYADAVTTYLGLGLSRIADYHNALCTWLDQAKNEGIGHLFTRQTLMMSWDFCEGNPFSESSGNLADVRNWVADALQAVPASLPAYASQIEAATSSLAGRVISTDPPYYDNVGYSDLSDFFYVWLRRSLGRVYPDLLGTVLTPKADELIANPFRHNDANKFFEEGYHRVFSRIREDSPSDFPITVFYAFKQAEKDDDGGHASTGWEILLEGMLTAGWTVTGTWPIRSERSGRVRAIGSNALASSIVLVCRPRPTDAGFTDRRGLIQALREEFPEALRKLEQGKIAPVDLRQAAIGPGMAVFSRYARVNEPDGSAMRVRAALSLINQVLDEKLSQLEGNVSAETRWCVEWFKQCGFEPGLFGTAETLSKGIDTSIAGLERAGVLTSRAGKVKLLSVRELPDFYDPAADDRTSEWEICLHLAKALQDRGTDAAAALMAAARDMARIDLDDVRELSYLLYSIAEKKNWAETALLFNNLGTSWTDIEDASRKGSALAAAGQGEFTLEFGSDDDGDE
jgi:putative DNA methylase